MALLPMEKDKLLLKNIEKYSGLQLQLPNTLEQKTEEQQQKAAMMQLVEQWIKMLVVAIKMLMTQQKELIH